ncbi:MAG: Unknown protein [uncultured Thiotrichaceae bacterium]|uniref:DUF7379 domain-containing protein n=1 Tax=uncultured Thiotrichaceae bacterium TaxID=298394 RepID=A0A6S6SU74_9GAMM|nr:MAG: Unknown protein [uncultured Thiotrichaceae bacterium]
MVDRECEDVILVHGLLMRPIMLRLLGYRLSQAGYRVHYAHVATLRRTSQENAQNLHVLIQSLDAAVVHLVAHSLGGLVLMHLFEQYDDIPPGKVVMLGSPIQGSQLAQHLFRYPVFHSLLKKGMRRALSGSEIPVWNQNRTWGMIAGNKALGVGVFLGGLSGQSDGTVALSETHHEKLNEHVVVKVSHLAMQFSHLVALYVMNFLKTGSFHH